MSQAKSQPCINCGSKVETTEGEVEYNGESFPYVHRNCKSCGFSWRVRFGRHSTYVFGNHLGIGRFRLVPLGVLLVGDEHEIGSRE